MSDLTRCPWSESSDMMRAYHDTEWGVPEYDSRALWEKLQLDGFQAGLSWSIILKKRDAFRELFAGFDPAQVAAFDAADIERLVIDERIIRSRAKIVATIGNARAYLAMQEAGEDFADFVWGMAGGTPILGDGVHVPVKSPLSEDMSKALKKRGFKFVGPVIVYAWLEACGVVDDHLATCWRHAGHMPSSPGASSPGHA
ncbi:DNA-3-methyladenine glycosylase I [Sphingomonas hylomeconis]|uniref:DNA-3-methyladenine glycosylase I n=1 Tax=Sphingomonas hylomeconis TaxID=1395958 RepID=A0ABV7SVU9_9SPHN|nr:DNA-3-methyladenine glycosylase I [Sphingomonas hylomeconis]